jgi:SAM-dependent methyltransferase
MDAPVRFHRFRYHLASGFVTPNDLVADYGCGQGYGSYILASKALQVIAIDKEESNIACAEEKYSRSNIVYKVRDLETVRVPVVDVAVALESLEHLYHPEAFITWVKARTERYIIASVPLNQPLTTVDGDIQEVGDSTHHFAFTKESFMEMFIDSKWSEFWSFQDGVTLIAVFYNNENIT